MVLLTITLLVAALPDGGTLFTTKTGVVWRVTKTAGAVPSSSYEQSYQRLDRLGPKGDVLATWNFEERAWVRAEGADRVWVDFSLDDRGELQVLQHERPPRGKETVTRFRWNGKGFDRTVL